MSDHARNPMATPRVHTPDHHPDDLYRAAQRAWDSRMDSILTVDRRKNLIIYGLTGLVVALLASHAFLYSQKTLVAALVNEKNSDIIPIRGEWVPSDGAKRSRLQDLIEKWRAKPIDPFLYKKNQDQVAEWIDTDTFKRIRDDYEAAKSRPTCSAVDVNVRTIQPLNDGLWQVRWEEVCFLKGKRLPTETFTGIGGFRAAAPETLSELEKNPLGLILTKFNWTQDYARSSN
ncbi:VirB8/TrbF family protein [Elstera sp.]|uniref:VirB8/TrbF family protein n=1 Tax=Elstera sp. TaxID=1916664 RepID=UPI0037C10709